MLMVGTFTVRGYLDKWAGRFAARLVAATHHADALSDITLLDAEIELRINILFDAINASIPVSLQGQSVYLPRFVLVILLSVYILCNLDNTIMQHEADISATQDASHPIATPRPNNMCYNTVKYGPGRKYQIE